MGRVKVSPEGASSCASEKNDTTGGIYLTVTFRGFADAVRRVRVCIPGARGDRWDGSVRGVGVAMVEHGAFIVKLVPSLVSTSVSKSPATRNPPSVRTHVGTVKSRAPPWPDLIPNSPAHHNPHTARHGPAPS